MKGIDSIRKLYNGTSNKSKIRIFDPEGATYPVDYPYHEIVALVKASSPAHAKWAMNLMMADLFPIKAGDTVAKLHNTGMLTTRRVQDIVFTDKYSPNSFHLLSGLQRPLGDHSADGNYWGSTYP